ncbi:M48 family metallopeptidase [Mycoplasma hafezii]|uniref:M48 family metallopeptidase n=1 Tax=Mycoplasma hafezii TaxID=525886 RepID=UPI003CF847C4
MEVKRKLTKKEISFIDITSILHKFDEEGNPLVDLNEDWHRATHKLTNEEIIYKVRYFFNPKSRTTSMKINVDYIYGFTIEITINGNSKTFDDEMIAKFEKDFVTKHFKHLKKEYDRRITATKDTFGFLGETVQLKIGEYNEQINQYKIAFGFLVFPDINYNLSLIHYIDYVDMQDILDVINKNEQLEDFGFTILDGIRDDLQYEVKQYFAAMTEILYLELLKELKIKNPPELKWKSKKTSWASYSRKTHSIIMNENAYFLSVPVIRYILCHELAHINTKGHGEEFYKKLEQYCPDYKEIKKEM